MSGASGLELSWPGKFDGTGARARPPAARPALTPFELHGGEARDLLLWGDNLAALDGLLARAAGTVDLVYMDPPFATGSTFDLKVRGTKKKKPTRLRIPAYDDRFEDGVAGLLAMLDLRLQQIVQLLSPTGSLYVHVDPRASHYVKALLDELLGPQCFQREIVWRIGWVSGYKSRARNWIRNHDTILFYTRDPKRFTFNKVHIPHPEGYQRRGAAGKAPGIPADDVWNASPAEFALEREQSLTSIQIKSFSSEKTGYGTQKNESLLRRIISASSNPGDLVLDPFLGSGTTMVAARALGRRAIGIDASATAVAVARQRLLTQGASTGLEICTVGEGPLAPKGGQPRFRFSGLSSGEVEVALRDYEPGDERLKTVSPEERVQVLLVDWGGGSSVFSAHEAAVRPPGGGLVEFKAGPRKLSARREHRVRLRVVDALGATTTTTVTLQPTGAGLRRV